MSGGRLFLVPACKVTNGLHTQLTNAQTASIAVPPVADVNALIFRNSPTGAFINPQKIRSVKLLFYSYKTKNEK